MYRYFKRCFDLISALLLLIAISPVMVILAIIVRLNFGRPIFFKQERSGRNMQPFMLIKFRTMTDAKDSEGNLLPDHKRVTKFGRFLRSSSLDELPELINIIKGDMSVIGPRPLPTHYNPYYRQEELSRFNVRGGLVTPDSVDRDPIISWDKQLKYESDYSRNLSLVEDIMILVGVFRILFKRTNTDYGGFERLPLNIERAKDDNITTNVKQGCIK